MKSGYLKSGGNEMKIKRAIFVLGVALCMVFLGGCGLENQSVSSDGFVEEAEDEKIK